MNLPSTSKYEAEYNKYTTFLLPAQFEKLKIDFIGTTYKQSQYHLNRAQL